MDRNLKMLSTLSNRLTHTIAASLSALIGIVRGTYSITIDIAERKDTEEKIRQMQRLEALGKLTGGVAHNINNMLAIISGNLELACEDIGRGIDVRNRLQTALRATERGSTLTQSLLSFTRQQPLMPQSIDLNDFAREVVAFSKRTAPKNVSIELEPATDLKPCAADPGQLQNALLNLIVNAIDAMPDGGDIAIKTGSERVSASHAKQNDIAPGVYAVVSVSDTGAGMPHDVLAHVFEPFFTTKAVGKGTGLGLSMVYGFARQSKGHVTIDSETGKGTTVKLYLPVTAANGCLNDNDMPGHIMRNAFDDEIANG